MPDLRERGYSAGFVAEHDTTFTIRNGPRRFPTRGQACDATCHPLGTGVVHLHLLPGTRSWRLGWAAGRHERGTSEDTRRVGVYRPFSVSCRSAWCCFGMLGPCMGRYLADMYNSTFAARQTRWCSSRSVPVHAPSGGDLFGHGYSLFDLLRRAIGLAVLRCIRSVPTIGPT